MQYFWYFANCDESNWEEECISFPVSRRNTSHITFTVNSSKTQSTLTELFHKKIFYCSGTVIAIILFDYCCFYFPWQILIWRRCCCLFKNHLLLLSKTTLRHTQFPWNVFLNWCGSLIYCWCRLFDSVWRK